MTEPSSPKAVFGDLRRDWFPRHERSGDLGRQRRSRALPRGGRRHAPRDPAPSGVRRSGAGTLGRRVRAALGLAPHRPEELRPEPTRGPAGQGGPWSAARVADEVGVAPSTANAWRRGRTPESFLPPSLERGWRTRRRLPLQVRAHVQSSIHGDLGARVRFGPRERSRAVKTMPILRHETSQPLPRAPGVQDLPDEGRPEADRLPDRPLSPRGHLVLRPLGEPGLVHEGPDREIAAFSSSTLRRDRAEERACRRPRRPEPRRRPRAADTHRASPRPTARSRPRSGAPRSGSLAHRAAWPHARRRTRPWMRRSPRSHQPDRPPRRASAQAARSADGGRPYRARKALEKCAWSAKP